MARPRHEVAGAIKKMIKLLFHSKHKNFSRLWFAQLISQFGDRIHQLALVGLVAERADGSATDLAKLLAFTILPVFVVQPFAGVFVDRWNRRTTLFICDIFRGLLVLSVPFIFIHQDSMIPIYFVVFFAFCFSRFYVPAKMSIIPEIVDESNLLKANSLVTTTGMIAFVLGCALGGFLVENLGARNGFILDSATFFVSAMLLFSINIPKRLHLSKEELVDTGKEIVGRIKGTVFEEMRDGFKYLIEHKEIRFVVCMLFILLSAAGAIYVVIIVFIQNAFGSITKDLGVLAVFLGVGLFSGVLVYGKVGKHFSKNKTIFFCLTAGGAMLIIFAFVVQMYPSILLAMALATLLGLIVGPIFIASNTLVHIEADEEMRGKVFSALEMVIHFAFLISMLISSWLSNFVEEVWILAVVGVIFSIVGFVGYIKK